MSNVTTIVPTTLQPMTLSIVSDIASELLAGDAWLLGDDASAIATVASDLAVLTGIMDAGVRDDDEIRTEATRLARILQRRAARDFAGGLVDADHDAMNVVLHPDQWERMLEDTTPMPSGAHTITVTGIETGTDDRGRGIVRLDAAVAA